MKSVFAAIALVSCVGYNHAAAPAAQSRFFVAFSLGRLIEEHQAKFNLDCSVMSAGGGAIGGTGAQATRYQKSHTFTCRLMPGGKSHFDAAGFLAALAATAEKEIAERGAKVESRGRAEAGMFSFGYSTDEVIGGIEVVGRRVEGGGYEVRAELNERGR